MQACIGRRLDLATAARHHASQRNQRNGCAIARLPEAPQVENPLDAVNAEIILGPPVSPGFGRLIRMAVPVLTGLFSLPFLIAFWIGELEFALGLLLPLGLIAALALYRYAHRLSGAFWIIRHGEIRIERIALNGQPTVNTIRASDVAAIEVDKPDPATGPHHQHSVTHGGNLPQRDKARRKRGTCRAR